MTRPPPPARSPKRCEHCGTPYVWSYKFNGGNPRWFELDDCDCADDMGWGMTPLG